MTSPPCRACGDPADIASDFCEACRRELAPHVTDAELARRYFEKTTEAWKHAEALARREIEATERVVDKIFGQKG